MAESSQQEIIKKKTNQQDLSNSTTPIESIVKGVPLANTYYYSFAEGTPNSVKQVFSLAIATYNNTGIVKLVPGTGEAGQNTVVFSTYYTTEDDPDVQQSTEELGKGGPEIFKSSISSYNHGRALINLQYPDEAISQAVATHELGHALGLGHSKDPQSVMYPMDKGMTALTQNDINTLHAIYD
ncbi:hypothetical protein ABM34_06515 [Companilactobacillus ginsenosidimutans]|uniref:Peptidase metallopeptidase domain-containing protein n=1 Tax=Companilactobacillus ginsenosidimutans TaxID=1007676 RepID=A0A0H4QJ29_9LACO|nr:hypothetical protein ABM34_06515 [Companilactobacillus ginsenosidimutans]